MPLEPIWALWDHTLVVMGTLTFVAIFEFYMASQRPRRHLKKTSWSQWPHPHLIWAHIVARRPHSCPILVVLWVLGNPEILSNGPFSVYLDLPMYSPSNFGDPSRVVRNALVYRHFLEKKFYLLKRRWVSGPANRQTYPKAWFQGRTSFACFWKTTYF